MRALVLPALICVGLSACGDGSVESAPRRGSVGSGETRADGGVAVLCDCPLGQECSDSGVCVARCDDPTQLCGDDGELCDPPRDGCMPRDSVDVCQLRSPPGELTPIIGCRWTPPEAPTGASAEEAAIVDMGDVAMTPSVANLTDDNGDGRPEVIIGNVVLDGLTGRGPGDPDLPADALAWDGRALALMTPGVNLGIGNNGF